MCCRLVAVKVFNFNNKDTKATSIKELKVSLVLTLIKFRPTFHKCFVCTSDF